MLMFVLDGTSRMTGDCHVRFCERLRGETPLCLLGAFVSLWHISIVTFTSSIMIVTQVKIKLKQSKV